jgi:oxygen-independent coproporphyrinogen-3 oxidase
MKGLYVHIPFCARKCAYCDFVSQAYDNAASDAYINALSAEMQKYRLTPVNTVYIGGGTPSTLSVRQLNTLLNDLRDNFNISQIKEFTVELNPESTTIEKLKLFKNMDINRLSIGLQSPNNAELSYLGRVHNLKQFEEAFYNARTVGFNNINIDLMYGFQTLKEWENNLAEILKFATEHISLYPLTIEEGTLFYKNSVTVDYDLQSQMYGIAVNILQSAGYIHYEISNWSKPEKQSLHNSNYWRNKEYIGIGAAAASYLNRWRYKNTDNIADYIKSPTGSIIEKEFIDDEIFAREAIILSLRLLNEGADIKYFNNIKLKQALEKLLSQGLVLNNSGKIVINPKYVFISNGILEQFF